MFSPHFTWLNVAFGVRIFDSKIDHAFFDGMSDHFSLIVGFSKLAKSNKPFKLFNSWIPHPKHIDLVWEVWSEVMGTRTFSFTVKLRKLMVANKLWAKLQLSNFSIDKPNNG